MKSEVESCDDSASSSLFAVVESMAVCMNPHAMRRGVMKSMSAIDSYVPRAGCDAEATGSTACALSQNGYGLWKA